MSLYSVRILLGKGQLDPSGLLRAASPSLKHSTLYLRHADPFPHRR